MEAQFSSGNCLRVFRCPSFSNSRCSKTANERQSISALWSAGAEEPDIAILPRLAHDPQQVRQRVNVQMQDILHASYWVTAQSEYSTRYPIQESPAPLRNVLVLSRQQVRLAGSPSDRKIRMFLSSFGKSIDDRARPGLTCRSRCAGFAILSQILAGDLARE